MYVVGCAIVFNSKVARAKKLGKTFLMDAVMKFIIVTSVNSISARIAINSMVIFITMNFKNLKLAAYNNLIKLIMQAIDVKVSSMLDVKTTVSNFRIKIKFYTMI